MPTYNYSCPSCEKIEEQFHKMSENPEYKCPDCGTVMVRLISPNSSGFIIRGGTPTTNYREKRLRKKRSHELKRKQQERQDEGPQVKPNIAGVETGTWSDAQKLAKEAGMNHESYTPFVEKEKKKKIVV